MSEATSTGDEVLARRAAAGDDAAGVELIRRWAVPLRAYCARRAPPPLEAEDLMQDIFVAVVQRIGRKRTKSPFAAWLFSVARSVVVDAHRALRRRPSTVPYEARDREPATERTPAHAAAEADEEVQMWRMARQTLPARQVEALELRVRYGLDLAAIAAAMGLTTNHVKVLLFRARQRLMAAGAVKADVPAPGRAKSVAPVGAAAREG